MYIYMYVGSTESSFKFSICIYIHSIHTYICIYTHISAYFIYICGPYERSFNILDLFIYVSILIHMYMYKNTYTYMNTHIYIKCAYSPIYTMIGHRPS